MIVSDNLYDAWKTLKEVVVEDEAVRKKNTAELCKFFQNRELFKIPTAKPKKTLPRKDNSPLELSSVEAMSLLKHRAEKKRETERIKKRKKRYAQFIKV